MIGLILWLAVVLTGTASWGDFDGHVITRLPRGTSIFFSIR